MAANSLSIVLDSPNDVYTPGSIVSGKLFFDVAKVRKSRYITVSAYGHAKTHFSKLHSDGNKNESVSYSSKKTYFDYTIPVWKPKSGDKEEIPVGNHSYPFSFTIPWQCPPNYEGRWGHIRYNIRAEVHQSWHFNIETEKRFTIVSIMDATIPNQPQKGFLSKCGTFSHSKTVNAEITLPKKIFAVGEDIPITIVINNQSGTTIEAVETGIQTESCYNGEASFSACSRYKSEHECLHSLVTSERFEVPDGERKVYYRTLHLSKPLPTINDCPIIMVKNFLYVSLHKKGMFSSTASTTVPIIITTATLEPIRSTPPVIDEDTILNSAMGMDVRSSSSPQDLRNHIGGNSLYPAFGFRPSSVPHDIGFTDAFGAPPAYSEIDTNGRPEIDQHPEASAPPPGYEETMTIQKF